MPNNDEYLKIFAEQRKKNRLKKILNKFKTNKHIRIITIIFIIITPFFIVYKVLTAPPTYTDKETKINGEKFESLIKNTEQFESKFIGAIKVLKQQPRFYKKVVNNIDEIIIEKRCKYACVVGYLNLNSFWDLIVSPKYTGKIPLSINPNSINVYDTNYKFASMLIHEADHVEYLKSEKLRKIALMVKCNPITNFHISVDSAVPSIIHRVSPMEICAQREQIKFHKATKTESGYEIKNGLFYNFSKFIFSAFKFFFSLFISIFKAFF